MRASGVHPLRPLLTELDFRRLLRVRLAGPAGDGLFPGALFGAAFFTPEKATSAAAAASAFATVLLPYSLVGPFAGVLLDRWSRQRVLVVANVVRACGVLVVGAEILGGLHGQPFYASALVVVSISRFFLSALSAALPHVIDPA